MASLNYVKFQRGTNAAYQNLKTLNKLDSDTLYFTYDSIEDTIGSLYLGDKLICDNASPTEYGIADLTDVTLGTDLTNNHILIYNGSKWINVASSTLLSNVYSKSEVDAKIAAIPSSSGGLKYRVVESTSSIDLTAADADQYIYLIAHTSSTNDAYDEYLVVNGNIEKIGTLSVDLTDYVTASELTNYLSNYIQKVEGSRLITSAEISKIEGIEIDAEKNVINSVDTQVFSITDERKLELVSIPVSKIEGYSENGPRLITAEEIQKLSQLDLNGNAYVLQTIYTAEVGTISNLTDYDADNPTTLVDEINSINERLVWGEISAT